MLINFENETAAVISCLEQNGYSAKTLIEHRRCYNELQKHLLDLDTPFSMDIAVIWLARRKNDWAYDTYKRYRRALYRFEKYLKSHRIDNEPYCHKNCFAYFDVNVSYVKLPDGYKALFHKFHITLSALRSKSTVDHYISVCTDFLLFISEKGCSDPSKLTIDHLLEYLKRFRGMQWSADTKEKYTSGITKLLMFFSEQGYIPRCYSSIICSSEGEVTSIKLTTVDDWGKAFQPSKKLESLADEFLSRLEERRYSKPPQKLFGFVFNGFFLFLELNHLEYSPEMVKLWLEHIPRDTSWKLRRQIINWFANFLKTGKTDKCENDVWRPLLIDTLPDWSRHIISDYMTLRQREGCANSTLLMCRSACARFFCFIEHKGLNSAKEITASLIKEFHITDPHTTAEGRNAYSTRIRKLLIYMAERNLVPQNLYLAVSTQCTQRRKIVSVMSTEMESAIYSYRENSVSPSELRNTAIVMIGMRMGLRSSDIVNIRIDDIDWKNKKISIIQSKTNKAISLPLPTDVGNSVYRYITQGRPSSGTLGVGYVFICHKAPFSKLDRSICQDALENILSTYGMKLPSGQGFHITRRTFATRLLTSRTAVDTIADALGHNTRQSLTVYLAHDENGMRLCPLSFVIGGQQ